MESFSDTRLAISGSVRNKPSKRQQYQTALLKREKPEKAREPVLKIYAELSRKDYQKIMDGELEVCLPPGVSMKNKSGSRGLFFECVDEDTTKILIDGLEESGIPWQEN